MRLACLIMCVLATAACARPNLSSSTDTGPSAATGTSQDGTVTPVGSSDGDATEAEGGAPGEADKAVTGGPLADPTGSDQTASAIAGENPGDGRPSVLPAGDGSAEGACGLGPATCDAATSLGEISGRDGSQQFQTSGRGNAFFNVRIENPNTSFGSCFSPTGGFGDDGNFKAELVVPDGTDYDLFIHGSDSDACEPQEQSAQQSDAAESAEMSWQWTSTGGGFSPPFGTTGGSDACERVVTVEVLHIEGDCDNDWTLTVDASN